MEALVLMYHQIVADGAPDGWVPAPLADPRYGVTRLEFARQMTYLREEGYTLLPLGALLSGETAEIPRASTSGRPAVVITFDDGYASDLALAMPILAHLGIPATFFVATGHIGAPGMLSEKGVAELAARPLFRIGGHGESHRFLSELSESECRSELVASFDRIRTLTGQETAEMSAPGGRTSPRVAALARRAGFRALATSRPGLHYPAADPFSLPRLPILRRHNLRDFSALLDPRSRTHRANEWIRSAKQAARSALRILSPGKGG